MQKTELLLLRFILLIPIVFFSSLILSAQDPVDSVPGNFGDTLPDVDTSSQVITVDSNSVITAPPVDSVSKRPLQLLPAWVPEPGLPLQVQVMKQHPYFHFTENASSLKSDVKSFTGKETMFYVIVALLIVFALLKISFAKYFNDLFRVFFRTTLKQRQIRDQLMQTPFPSLVFNIFFVASAGLYLNMVLHYFEFTPVRNFWLMYMYCCLGLSVIYFVKFVGLKICGWLFNMKGAADSYIFIVFIINKVIGIFILPFLVLLAFADEPLNTTALVISWAGIACLLLYRFILGFAAVRNEVRFNLFHFFLYLCAFEAAPLILIYKLLLLVF